MLKRLLLFISLTNLFFCSVYAKAVNPPCSVVQYTTTCKVERNKCTVESSMLIEIKDRSGEKYTEVSIPFSKKNKVTILLAQIETIDGTIIRQLKKSDYKDRSAISGYSLYEDDFIRTFELKHNVYPYRIRYQWKYDYDEFIDIVDWHPYLDEIIPTELATLEVRVPLNYPVKILKSKIEKASIDSSDQNLIYSFEVSNLVLPKKEIHSIPVKKNSSYVRVVPVSFKWAIDGSHNSWTDFGNWINNLNMETDDLLDSDKQKARDLTKGISSKRKKVEVLYNYLQQNTRYINVSIGTGGLKPYPASYVALNKYGDCKALSVYMKSMLQAAEIPSFYTVVYAGGNNPGITKDLAALQFNHAILCVPLEKDTVFLDCTRKNVPIGYMGTFTQGREALIIKKDSSHFGKIPDLSLNEVKEENSHTYSLSAGDNCFVEICSKSRGDKFDFLSAMDMNLNYAESEKLLREYYFHFPSFELKDWKLNQPYKDSAYVMLHANLQLDNFIKSYGNDFGFSIYPLSIENYEKPSDRKWSLSIEYPECIEDIFVYKLSLLRPKLLPENILIDNRFGRYSLKTTVSENVITIYRKFELFQGEYSLNEYPDFYIFIQQVQKSNKLIIMLTK